MKFKYKALSEAVEFTHKVYLGDVGLLYHGCMKSSTMATKTLQANIYLNTEWAEVIAGLLA